MLGLNKKGLVLQTVYREINTDAYLYDSNLNLTLMPNTTLLISTSGNSKLRAIFPSSFVLIVENGFSSSTEYEIIISINEIINKNKTIYYYSGSAVPHMEFSTDLYISI